MPGFKKRKKSDEERAKRSKLVETGLSLSSSKYPQ